MTKSPSNARGGEPRAPDDLDVIWNESQVASLNAYQEAGVFHPFTYDDGDDQVNLIATPKGWVAREGGKVVQRWAHAWMLDWRWDARKRFFDAWKKAQSPND